MKNEETNQLRPFSSPSRAVSRLLPLLAICLIPIAHASGSSVLYDQLNNQHSTGTDSDDFWDLPVWTSFTADDFVVPADQTWRITEVDVRGAFAGTGPAQTFNVVFYQDIGGLPGTAVHIATAQEYGSNDGFYRITLKDPSDPGVRNLLGFGSGWPGDQREWHLDLDQPDRAIQFAGGLAKSEPWLRSMRHLGRQVHLCRRSKIPR
jgi:hypothetical protein